MKFKKIEICISGASHFPNKKENKYYFEARDEADEPDTIINDGVFANNIGSYEASRDILDDAIKVGLIEHRYQGIYEYELLDIYDEVVWNWERFKN